MPKMTRKTSISLIFNSSRTLKAKMNRHHRNNVSILCFIAVLCFVVESKADRVGNGGEFSEKLFVEVYEKIPTYINACLLNSNCLRNFGKSPTLQKVLSSFPHEVEQSKPLHQIQFLSAKKHPEIFGNQASKQIWSTRPFIGSPIFINTDEIHELEVQPPATFANELAFRCLFVALATHVSDEDLLILDELAIGIFQLVFENGPNFTELKATKAASGYLREDPLPAEEWLRFYFELAPRLIKICLQDSRCLESEDDRGLLFLISQSLDLEPAANKVLRFDSATRNPSLFTIDGVVKSAVTGLRPGDPIYFNLDHIYTIENNRENAIAPDLILALLIHELGHHTGSVDHKALDLLGSKLAFFFSRYYPRITFQEDPDFIVFHKPVHFRSQYFYNHLPDIHKNSSSLFFMADELYWRDSSAMISAVLLCDEATHPARLRVTKAGWTGQFQNSKQLVMVPYNFKGQKYISIVPIIYDFNVQATLICQNEMGQPFIQYWNRNLKLQYTREYRPSELGPDSFPTAYIVFDRLL